MNVRDFKYLWNSDAVEFVKSEAKYELPVSEIWRVKKTGEELRVTYEVTVRIVEIEGIAKRRV